MENHYFYPMDQNLLQELERRAILLLQHVEASKKNNARLQQRFDEFMAQWPQRDEEFRQRHEKFRQHHEEFLRKQAEHSRILDMLENRRRGT